MTFSATRALPETGCPGLWLWPGQALYAGPSLRLDRHSGSVACLAVGVDAEFTVRADGRGEHTARSALVAPRVCHQLVAHGERMVFCYLDPASAREAACRASMRAGDPVIALEHGEQRRLLQLAAGLTVGPDATAAAQRWLDVAGPVPAGHVDERVRRAAARLREQTNPALSAAEVAAVSGLSTSRFLHLFRAHTGTSFRRYRMWTRMLCAATVLADGHDLTMAAAEAGFAGSAHLSDSFHAMFGLRPSRLLASGVVIRVEAAG